MESPMDLTYMRLLRRSLRYVDSWPDATFGERRRTNPLRTHRLLFCFWVTYVVLQILYIRDNIHTLSFVEIGQNYIIFFICILIAQRMSMPSMQSYGEVIKMFVSEMHLLRHKHKSKYAMKVYKQVHRICTFFCCLNHFQLVIGTLFYNVTPLMSNYRAGMFSSHPPDNGTFEHCIYCKLPFDYQHNFIGYLAVFLINTVMVVDLAYLFAIYDLQLYIIVFHTWGHLKLLEHNLRNFPRPGTIQQEGCSGYHESSPQYTTEESQELLQMLKDIIDHHRLLKNFVNKTSSAFGPMILFSYAVHQVCGCIVLLECSVMFKDPGKIAVYLLIALNVFHQLIELSIIFELIGSKSEALIDAVYSMPWECMHHSERRILLIFLSNVQTPIRLKAGGMVPVGVRTMTAIMKSTFSYFLMLRTVDNH